MHSVKQYLHDEVYQIRPFPWPTYIIILACIPFLLVIWWGIYPADDTYLSIRYAQSLAAGTFAQQLDVSGAVWSISPLHTILLAICAALNVPLTTAAAVFSTLGWGVAAVICSRLLRQLGYFTIAIFTPILLLVSPWLLLTTGSHAPWILVVGWLAFLAALTQNGRLQIIFSLLLLAISISWTAVSLIFILFIWQCLRQRRFVWQTAVLLSIPVIAALAILIWQAAQTLDQFPSKPIEWWAWWPEIIHSSPFFWMLLPLTIIAIWRQPKIWAIALWLGLVRLEASFSGQLIIATNLLLLAAIGIAEFSQWLVAQQKIKLDDKTAYLITVILLFLPLLWANVATIYGRFQQRPITLAQIESEAGQWLNRNSATTATILSSATIAYEANRPAHIWDNDQQQLAKLIQTLTPQPPEFIVSSRTAAWQQMTNIGWFRDNYTAVHQFTNPAESTAPLIIWQYQPDPVVQAPFQPLNVELQNGAKLVGYQQWPEAIQPGEAVHVALHWQQPITRAFVSVVWLPSPLDGANQALRDMLTPRALPPNWIQDGQTITEQVVITTTEKITPGGYQINVSFREQNSFERMPLTQNNDPNPLDRIQLGYVTVPWNGTIPDDVAPAQISFGEAIQLIGTELPHAPARPGDQLPITLYWQTTSQPQANYTVFLQLLNEAGELVTSGDAPPMGGQYATRAWLPGHTVPDAHTLNLPADLPPGSYTIKVGVYLPETGERLTAVDISGMPLPDNAYTLMAVEVE